MGLQAAREIRLEEVRICKIKYLIKRYVWLVILERAADCGGNATNVPLPAGPLPDINNNNNGNGNIDARNQPIQNPVPLTN